MLLFSLDMYILFSVLDWGVGVSGSLANIHDSMDKFNSHCHIFIFQGRFLIFFKKTKIWLLDYAALFFFYTHYAASLLGSFPLIVAVFVLDPTIFYDTSIIGFLLGNNIYRN